MPLEPQGLTPRTQVQDEPRRYYGKYRGLVADNLDPDKLGRLRLRVPSLLGEATTGWALPCLPFGGLGDQGVFSVPEINARVWVEFEAGDMNHPIWTGTFWQGEEIPGEAAKDAPTTRLIKTPAGHRLQFDDASGGEKIILHHSSEAQIILDENGSIALTGSDDSAVTINAESHEIEIEDSYGNTLTMDSSGTRIEDSNGNKIAMGAQGISIEAQMIELKGSQVMLGGAGGEGVIKGLSFLTKYATHMHTSTMPGTPSSPPVPQGEMASLSTGVTSK